MSSFKDLFSDDIHLNNAGNYFVAFVMYATIYGESPEGLTSNINDEYGVPYPNMPTPAQAKSMQQVAWSTVINLSTWTGVYFNLTITGFEEPIQEFSLYPNPSADRIRIVLENFNENEDVRIYNSMGVLVKEISVKNSDTIDISDFPKGVYFVQLKNLPNRTYKFIKN